MSAYANDRKTLAYQLGEALSSMTDHYLLMTATPHKGDPENFCLFLALLDQDVYGDVKSLQQAIATERSAICTFGEVKEAFVVSFPDVEITSAKFTNCLRTGSPYCCFRSRW